MVLISLSLPGSYPADPPGGTACFDGTIRDIFMMTHGSLADEGVAADGDSANDGAEWPPRGTASQRTKTIFTAFARNHRTSGSLFPPLKHSSANSIPQFGDKGPDMRIILKCTGVHRNAPEYRKLIRTIEESHFASYRIIVKGKEVFTCDPTPGRSSPGTRKSPAPSCAGATPTESSH